MSDDTPSEIVAGVMTAVHSEWDPGLGHAMEVAMSDAVTRAMATGVSVHDTETLLAWKAKAQQWCVAARDGGASIPDMLEAIARGDPWATP